MRRRTIRPEKRQLERVRYWQGQMLRARDFSNLQGVEAQRRWWHNRAVHNAFGVAEGLACAFKFGPSISPPILVSPGVAYDSFGRELILERTQTISLPKQIALNYTGAVSLLMRYKPPSLTIDAGSSSELCWCAPGSVAAGTAEFVWMQGSHFDPCAGVPVCAVDFIHGKELPRLDPNLRKASTKPVARPVLGSGATIPGSTAWEPWSVGFTVDENENPIPNYLGVQTWVDTSAAGFTRVPCYFASLQGPLWSPQTKRLVPALFPSIANESVAGFTFRLWLQVIEPPTPVLEDLTTRSLTIQGFLYVTWPDDFSLYARQEGLYVSWIGCQMAASIASCATPASGVSIAAFNPAPAPQF
jgi:hypothetical protein